MESGLSAAKIETKREERYICITSKRMQWNNISFLCLVQNLWLIRCESSLGYKSGRGIRGTNSHKHHQFDEREMQVGAR